MIPGGWVGPRSLEEAVSLLIAYGTEDSGALRTPPAGEAFVVYAALGERIAAWAIDREGISFRWLTAKRSQLAESADNLLRLSRAAMYRNRQSRRAA